jgi:hypothetical protein
MEELTDQERQTLRDLGLSDAEIDKEIMQAQQNINLDSPAPPIKDDALKLYRDVLNLEREDYEKISKTGNLEERELGMLPIAARTYLSISNYAESEDMDSVALYLRAKANIIAETSLSRKGFFMRLPVTAAKINKNVQGKKRITESSLFGGSKETVEGDDKWD